MVTYEQFVSARLPALLRYATALTGSPAMAEDVVQDALVRAQAHWRRVAAVERPEAYVRRIVLNEYLRWRRKRASRDVLTAPDRLEGLTAAVPDHAVAHGEADRMRLALAGLPRRQRAVLVLRFYEGLSDAEIAADLGCSTGTVRSHASRALATLRTAIKAEEASWTSTS